MSQLSHCASPTHIRIFKIMSELSWLLEHTHLCMLSHTEQHSVGKVGPRVPAQLWDTISIATVGGVEYSCRAQPVEATGAAKHPTAELPSPSQHNAAFLSNLRLTKVLKTPAQPKRLQGPQNQVHTAHKHGDTNRDGIISANQ